MRKCGMNHPGYCPHEGDEQMTDKRILKVTIEDVNGEPIIDWQVPLERLGQNSDQRCLLQLRAEIIEYERVGKMNLPPWELRG